MAQLRSVDPCTLVPNPDNPRRTATPKAMDEQLTASILAIGVIQPPRVKDVNGELVIIAGNRRTKAAIAAGLGTIDVLVCDGNDSDDAMRSISENLIRASMSSVDIWRATEALETQGWTEAAIGDALALPLRTIQRLKLLAHLHPAMLDTMAGGSMPNEEQLRTIAAALHDEQAQVWKKHKPKKGQEVAWYEVARALSKRRIPFAAAKFGDDLAAAYGVVWEDDLFAPAGEDGRFTTNVEGFFGAQQEWMQNSLPERATILSIGEYGTPSLPKKAERVYGKPQKSDITGYYLDQRSGEVQSVAYRIPEPKKAIAGGPTAANDANEPDADAPVARTRPDVTQKGGAMIGDFRTDALHEALRNAPIEDDTLLALLILAFAGRNVTVQGGYTPDKPGREEIAAMLTEGGVLTADTETLRIAARAMLTTVLSCRDNMTDSGLVARIAGHSIGASQFLPTMATEEFLSCLSKPGIERAAAAEGVRVEARGKDTRAQMIARFAGSTYVYPPALFTLTEETPDKTERWKASRWVPGLAGIEGHEDTGGNTSTDHADHHAAAVVETESKDAEAGIPVVFADAAD